jgi:hypothetical protein
MEPPALAVPAKLSTADKAALKTIIFRVPIILPSIFHDYFSQTLENIQYRLTFNLRLIN